MKKLLFIAFCCSVFSLFAAQKKSLVIMIDGMRADTNINIAMPNYNNLKAGKFADGYKIVWADNCRTALGAPADSAPNHVTIATGVHASKHGVVKNGTTKDGKYEDYPFYMSRLFEKGKIKKGAFLYTWSEDAQIKVKGVERWRRGDAGNVVQLIDLLEKNNTPDALQIYIDLPDHDGHKRAKVMGLNGGFYPYSPKYAESIKQADKWIGDILTAVRKRSSFANEDWYIVICADHGGYEHFHGKGAGNQAMSVPLLVVSKNLKSGGKLAVVPSLTDIAPSILNHFGIDIADMKIDGRVIDGAAVRKNSALNNGLVYYLDFDKKITDNGVSDKTVSVFGKEPAKVQGKFGSAVEFKKDNGCLQLAVADKLEYANENNFTVCFWLKSDKVTGDPAFFGNKSWNDGRNAGLVLVRRPTYRLNIGSADKKVRKDIEKFSHLNEWLFFAVTVKDGTIYFVQGMPDGNLYFMSERIDGLTVAASMPWTLGQDGTGKYSVKLECKMDDFALWTRGLEMSELKTVFEQGCKGIPLKEIIDAGK